MTNTERIKDLERRIQELEDAAKKNTPWDWYKFPTDNKPWPEYKNECPSCGMNFEGSSIWGFVCSSSKCPMGAGPTMC